jgi:hypothetical protein
MPTGDVRSQELDEVVREGDHALAAVLGRTDVHLLCAGTLNLAGDRDLPPPEVHITSLQGGGLTEA